jgi:hypothetical protein
VLAYVHQFLSNVAFSVVIEGAVAFGMYRLLWGSWRLTPIAAAVVGTLLTIPYVWFVFPTLLWATPTLIVVVGEGFAVCVETILYRYVCNISLTQALLLSISANAASYLLGLLV